MDIEARIASACGSFAFNVIVGTLLLAGLQTNWCGDLACRGAGRIDPTEFLLPRWAPWVDTLTGKGPAAADKEPDCPRASMPPGAVRLQEAPLPAGYDPAGRRAGRLVACVKLDRRARIVSAYLLPGTGGRVPTALLRKIRHEWRFSATRGDPSGWQRVRLYEEPAEPPAPFICGQLDWSDRQGCAPVLAIAVPPR